MIGGTFSFKKKNAQKNSQKSKNGYSRRRQLKTLQMFFFGLCVGLYPGSSKFDPKTRLKPGFLSLGFGGEINAVFITISFFIILFCHFPCFLNIFFKPKKQKETKKTVNGFLS